MTKCPPELNISEGLYKRDNNITFYEYAIFINASSVAMNAFVEIIDFQLELQNVEIIFQKEFTIN